MIGTVSTDFLNFGNSVAATLMKLASGSSYLIDKLDRSRTGLIASITAFTSSAEGDGESYQGGQIWQGSVPAVTVLYW